MGTKAKRIIHTSAEHTANFRPMYAISKKRRRCNLAANHFHISFRWHPLQNKLYKGRFISCVILLILFVLFLVLCCRCIMCKKTAVRTTNCRKDTNGSSATFTIEALYWTTEAWGKRSSTEMLSWLFVVFSVSLWGYCV